MSTILVPVKKIAATNQMLQCRENDRRSMARLSATISNEVVLGGRAGRISGGGMPAMESLTSTLPYFFWKPNVAHARGTSLNGHRRSSAAGR